MSSKMTPEERKVFEAEYKNAKEKFDRAKQDKRLEKIKAYAIKKAEEDSMSMIDKLSKGMVDTGKGIAGLGKALAGNADNETEKAVKTNIKPRHNDKKDKKKKHEKSFAEEAKEALL